MVCGIDLRSSSKTPIMTSQVFISEKLFRALHDYEGLKKHFSTCNISAMQCPITLKLRDMFIWLLINTWAKNKKIEISVHLTFKIQFLVHTCAVKRAPLSNLATKCRIWKNTVPVLSIAYNRFWLRVNHTSKWKIFLSTIQHNTIQ